MMIDDNTPTRAHARSSGALFIRQVRYEQLLYWRNRQSVIFTFALPLVLLVVFATIYSGKAHVAHLDVSYVTFYVPGLLAFGLISSTYTNLATNLATLRDNGVLKRVAGTPLPKMTYLLAVITSTLLSGVVMTIFVLGIGVGVYGITLRISALPGLFGALIVGSLCFAAIGIAVSGFVRRSESAGAVVNFPILVLTFVSGVFFPVQGEPSWLSQIVKVFPVEHFAHALQYPFQPNSTSAGFSPDDLLVLGLWFVIGIAIFRRRFRWTKELA